MEPIQALYHVPSQLVCLFLFCLKSWWEDPILGHKDPISGYKDLDPGYKDLIPGYKDLDPGYPLVAH